MPLRELPLVIDRSAAKGIVIGSRSQLSESDSAEVMTLAREVKVPVMIGGTSGDENLEKFESVGGVYLGNSLEIGINILLRTVQVFGRGGVNRNIP